MKTALLFFFYLAFFSRPLLGQDSGGSPRPPAEAFNLEEQVAEAIAEAQQLTRENKQEEALALYAKVLVLQGFRRDYEGRFDQALEEISRTYLEKGELAQAILVSQYTLKSSAKSGRYSGHAARSFRFAAELNSLFANHAEAVQYLLEERVPWYRMPSLKNDLLALINSIDLAKALTREGKDLRASEKYLKTATSLFELHRDEAEYQRWQPHFLQAQGELRYALALQSGRDPGLWQEGLEEAQDLLSEARDLRRGEEGLSQPREIYEDALLAAKIFYSQSYLPGGSTEQKVAALRGGITELEEAYKVVDEPLLRGTLKHQEGVLRRRLASLGEKETPSLSQAADAFHAALLISEMYLRELQSSPVVPKIFNEAVQGQLRGERGGLEPFLAALRRQHERWLGDYLDTIFSSGTRFEEAVSHLMTRRLGRKEPDPQLGEKDVLIDTFVYRQQEGRDSLEPRLMYASLILSPAFQGEQRKVIFYTTPATQVDRLIVDWKLHRSFEAFSRLWTPLLKSLEGHQIKRIFIGGDGRLGSLDYAELLIPNPLQDGQPTSFSDLPLDIHYGQTGFAAWYQTVAVDQR